VYKYKKSLGRIFGAATPPGALVNKQNRRAAVPKKPAGGLESLAQVE
jgi:hypothetical protein